MVSICMATYNSSYTIRRTLYSIKNQVYQDFEVIIVDDMSTDDTYDIIQNEFCAVDSRFKLYRCEKENRIAYADAHNMSYELAQGEYLCRIDHDDILFDDYLITHVQFMDGHPDIDAHCCGIRMLFLDEDNKVPTNLKITSELFHAQKCKEYIEMFNKFPAYAFNLAWQRDATYYPWHNNTSILRKSFYDKYHPKYVMQETGDLLFWRNVMSYGAKLHISPDEHILVLLFQYEKHPIYDSDVSQNYFAQYIAAKFAFEAALFYSDDVLFEVYNGEEVTGRVMKEIFWNTVIWFKDKLIEENKWDSIPEEFKKLNVIYGYQNI